MNLYTNVKISSPQQCPYLEDRSMRHAFFYASEVSDSELDCLLLEGWRKFGIYYFRPQCLGCSNCIPLRIPVNTFHMSRSQRRLWRANSDIQMRFEPSAPFDELYKIYEEHSLNRFGTITSKEEFESNFFTKSCNSAYSLYYLHGMLIAAGFLDLSSYALSSVYFIYLTKFLARGLGNYSVLREIKLTAELGLQYYYLGYFVAGNSKMQYKAEFYPYEYYQWENKTWKSVINKDDGGKLR